MLNFSAEEKNRYIFWDMLYREVEVVSSPEDTLGMEILVAKEAHVVADCLEDYDYELDGYPQVYEGYLIPASVLKQEIATCDKIYILIVDQFAAPELIDLNEQISADGLFIKGKFKEIERGGYSVIDALSNAIEREVKDAYEDIENIYVFLGYKLKTYLVVDKDSRDESKLENPEKIADHMQEIHKEEDLIGGVKEWPLSKVSS